jgi:hypothetical protein
MILDGNDAYKSGYNKALKDCVRAVDDVKEIEHIAVKGKYLSDYLSSQIESLEM